MTTTTITIYAWGSAPDAVAEVLSQATQGASLDAPAYESPRGRALYEALGASPDDEEYQLFATADGRWSLIGLVVEGHRFAIETQTTTERHVVEWQDEHGTWQLPGCTEDEATHDTHTSALATIEHMAAQPEWADCPWRIVSHCADGVTRTRVR